MEFFPPALERLVEQFARLPGIGSKSAQRLAFYVLSLPQEEADAFAVRALEQMLFYPKPADQRTEFTLLAFEGYAVPLVGLLTDGCRAEVAERYKKRTPPRRMMPNQKKLWRALTRH